MPTIVIDPKRWPEFFSRLDSSIDDTPVALNGDHGEFSGGLPHATSLRCLSYSAEENRVEITTSQQTYTFPQPRRILAEMSGNQVHSVEIIDDDEIRHVIHILEPVVLSRSHV